MKPNELIKDFRKLQKVKVFMDNAKAVARFERGNVEDIKIFILCSHGAFKDCLVKFKLDFSGNKYLRDKPGRKCLTNIFHPNINSDGSICFSIFDDHWNKDLRLVNYIDAFVFLLESPNHNSPLNSSCVEHDPIKFAKYVHDAALGEQVKGKTYERCKIEANIEDSQALSKFLATLEIYEANMTIYKDVECKMNEQMEKMKNIGKIRTLRPKLYSSLKKYSEKVRLLFIDLKSYLDGSEKEKLEDGIKRINHFCSHMEEVTEYAKNHEELAEFDRFEERFFDRVKKRFVGWKKNFLTDEQVHTNFKRVFEHINRLMKDTMGSIKEEEEVELEEIEEKGFTLDSHVSFCGRVRQFKENCETLFLVERKTQILRGRISGKLGGASDPRGHMKLFVDHDLKILRHEANKLYQYVLGDAEKTGELERGVEFIKSIRKNSKVNLEMSQNLYLLHEEIEEKKIETSEGLDKNLEESKRLIFGTLHPRTREPAEKIDEIRVKIRDVLDKCRKEMDRLIEKKKDEEERKDILSELMESSSDEENSDIDAEDDEEEKKWLWTYQGNRVVKKRRNEVLNQRLSNFRRRN